MKIWHGFITCSLSKRPNLPRMSNVQVKLVCPFFPPNDVCMSLHFVVVPLGSTVLHLRRRPCCTSSRLASRYKEGVQEANCSLITKIITSPAHACRVPLGSRWSFYGFLVQWGGGSSCSQVCCSGHCSSQLSICTMRSVSCRLHPIPLHLEP